MTPGDSILLSMENMNLHMPSLQFGRNFHFNVILNNPNNLNGTVNCNPTKRVDIMISTDAQADLSLRWAHSHIVGLS